MSLLALALLGGAVLALGCRKEKRTEPPVPASAAPGEATRELPLVLAKRAPQVGARTADASLMRIKLVLTIQAPGMGKPETSEVLSTESERRIEETLAVEGDARTRVKVSYIEKVTTLGEPRTSDRDGGVAPPKSPIVGKTYVVESVGGKLAVTGASGTAAPPVEAREVETEYASLGHADAIFAAMPGTAPRRGEPVAALSKAFEEEMARNAHGMTVGNGLVRYREASADAALFDVSFTLWRDEGPVRFATNLEGVMTVSTATSTLRAMVLKGPVTAAAKPGASAGAMTVTGAGVVEVSVTSAPL